MTNSSAVLDLNSHDPSNLSTENKKLSEKRKWEFLLNSLFFSQFPSDGQIELDENGENLLITASEETINIIKSQLNSPDVLRAGLNYIITEPGHSALPSADQLPISYPTMMPLTHQAGQKTYERLLGQSFLQRFGRFQWVGEIEEVQGEECFVLEGNCLAENKAFDDEQIKKTYGLLASATFHELRCALAEDEAQYKALPIRYTNDGVLAAHMDKLIYRDAEGTRVFFDYGLLMRYLQAPDLKKVENLLEEKAENSQVLINKMHLMQYLGLVFKEGFVLNREGHPILLGGFKRSIPLKNVVSLILDCSQSMAPSRAEYLGQVKNFIDAVASKLRKEDLEVRIISFSKGSKTQVFKWDSSNPSLLFDYINSLQMGGSTHLNNALHTELDCLLRNAQEQNTTLLLFTDGQDNDPDPISKPLLEQVVTRLKKQKIRPQLFALGLGKELDQDKLKQLANLTDGEFIHLQEIKDFEKILNHIERIGFVKEFVCFLQDKQEFWLPRYTERLSISTASLRPGLFEVGNKPFVLEAVPQNKKQQTKEDPQIVAATPTASALPKSPSVIGTSLFNSRTTGQPGKQEPSLPAGKPAARKRAASLS